MLKSLMLVSAAVPAVIALGSFSASMAQQSASAQTAASAAPATTSVKRPMPLDTKNPVVPTAASLAEAKTVYNRDCALCHGENGNGKTDLATSMNLTMGDWTNPTTLAGKQDAELFNAIRVGDSKMPGEDAGRAKDALVWNMIDYIRSFSKAQSVIPAAAVVKTAPPANRQ